MTYSHNLITYAGDGHYRVTVTLGISLTMPNKKSFFNLLLLKIFTGHNIENFSEVSRVWRHRNPFDSSGHTSLITSEHWEQKTVAPKIHLYDLKTMACGQDAINTC